MGGVIGSIIGIYLLITVLVFSFSFYEDNKELIIKHPILTFIVFTISWPFMFGMGVVEGIKKYKEEKKNRR